MSKLCNYPSSFDDSIAESVARFAYQQGQNADLLLVSGDLATTGIKDDMAVAAKYMNPAAFKYIGNESFPTIGAACKNVFFLPGNHDRYLDTAGNPGSREFEKVFSEKWGKQHPDVTHRILTKKSQRVGIVAVDFSLNHNMDAEAAKLHYGQGRVYQDRLDELVARTELLRDSYPDIFICWMIHFPPTSNCSFYLRLINHHWVEDAIKYLNIRIVFSGHTHESKLSTTNGATIVCAGSACSVENTQGNWVHIVEFDCQGQHLLDIKRVDYRWSDQVDDFVVV